MPMMMVLMILDNAWCNNDDTGRGHSVGNRVGQKEMNEAEVLCLYLFAFVCLFVAPQSLLPPKACGLVCFYLLMMMMMGMITIALCWGSKLRQMKLAV